MPKKKSDSTLRTLNKKISEVLQLERKQLRQEKEVIGLSKKHVAEEKTVESLEKQQLRELKELEKKVAEEIGGHPLKKITFKDLGKATIGAFVGIVSHYAVLEGVHFSETVTRMQATGFYIVAFIVGMIMLYYTGFRKIKYKPFLFFLPLRLTLIYLVTVVVILVVLSIFGLAGHGSLYNQVAVVMMPAIIGACAADLIGD